MLKTSSLLSLNAIIKIFLKAYNKVKNNFLNFFFRLTYIKLM